MYTGTFEPGSDTIMDVLYLARKYILPELIDDCVQLAKQFIHPANVWAILTKALQNQEDAICQACLTYIRLRTVIVLMEPNIFTNIAYSVLEFVLDNAIFNANEDLIFTFCMLWAKHQLKENNKELTPLNIRDVLGPCLYKFQFQNFTAEMFTKLGPPIGLLSDKTMVQFYRCITLGNERQDSDIPEEFEMKERPNETTQKARIQDADMGGKHLVLYKYSLPRKTKIKFRDMNTRMVTRLELKMFRCQCVKEDTRDYDCFFYDEEHSVKINGVACLEKIKYKSCLWYDIDECWAGPYFSPQIIDVFLYLKPQAVEGHCTIDIDLFPRNHDIFAFQCVREHATFVNNDNMIIMQLCDAEPSPIHSIKYLVSK